MLSKWLETRDPVLLTLPQKLKEREKCRRPEKCRRGLAVVLQRSILQGPVMLGDVFRLSVEGSECFVEGFLVPVSLK